MVIQGNMRQTRKIRKGKDIVVRWSLYRNENGERVPFAIDATAVLKVQTPYGTITATEVTIEGNVVSWTFRGKDQEHLGYYGLELVQNDGERGMVTVDTCTAFALVAHSCEETPDVGGDVVTDAVMLEGEVAFAPLVIELGGESYDDTELRDAIADLQEKDKATDTQLAEQSAKLTELSAEVGEVSVVVNGKPQETLEWQAEGYYAINSSVSEGAVVNINVQPQAAYRCLMVECSEGDSFLYTGRNGAFRPYAFLDSEYRLLPNYGVFGTKYKDEKITAPQGSAYVIMQTLNAEWVELGSLPLQRLGSKGIAEEAEKVKDAVLVTPNIRTAQDSMQAFSNLNVESKTLNNVFSYGDFSDTSVWTARSNTSLSFSNGISRMDISGTNLNMGMATAKASQIVVPMGGKAFFAIRMKTNQDNVLFKVSVNGTTYQEVRSKQAVSKNSDWEWSIIEWNPTNAYTASYLVLEANKQGANMTSDAWVEMKDFVVGIYGEDDEMTADKFASLLRPQEWFFGSVVIPNAERFIALDSQIRKDVVVSVGEGGDFQSLNAAMAYLSQFYPMYKYGGIKAEIRILNGTTITDQVLVVGADYSWMTITYEGYNPDGLTYDNVAESIANGTIVFGQTSGYNAVAVDASSWGSSGITHDTRGDVCLFRAEDGGRLPKIKCVFKLTNKGEYDVAGICCNRGSSCVVATLCGFIGFNDGVIANNESSITIREGITMNCGRWGCHSRHNGEVSARSVIAVGCATDAKYSGESAALCSDRIADLDGREAWVSCGNAFAVRNASRMNCNDTHILGSADETAIIYATAVGVGNFTSLYIDAGVKIDHSQGAMISVSEYTFRESYVFNDVTNKGIIYK